MDIDQQGELVDPPEQAPTGQMEMRQHVEKEIQGHQREAILRQQLKYIQQ